MIIQHTNFGTSRDIKSGVHENHNYGAHIHQSSEFVFVLDGELELTVDGRAELGKAGDVFCITPFRVHSFRTPKYSKIFIYVFSNDYALGLIDEEELYIGRERACFTPSSELSAYIERTLLPSTMHDAHEHREKRHRTVCACIHALLAEYFNTVPKSERSSKNLVLCEILLYISKHYREPIKLDTLSHALGYTKGHLSHILSAIPGFNFNALVNSLRIELAKRYLTESDRRSLDIALEVGFSCERSFHRVFKQLTGMTPREYTDKKRLDASFENYQKTPIGYLTP